MTLTSMMMMTMKMMTTNLSVYSLTFYTMETEITFSTAYMIQDLAKRMVYHWYTIISVADPQNYLSFCRESPAHWFVVWYIQYNRYSYSWSRSYISSKDFGSGQGIFSDRYEVGIDEIMLIERYTPNWEIKQYKNLDDYMTRNHWQNQIVTDKNGSTLYPKR